MRCTARGYRPVLLKTHHRRQNHTAPAPETREATLGNKPDRNVFKKADLNFIGLLGTAPENPTRPSSGCTDLVGGAVDVAVGLQPAGVCPDESLGESNVKAALDVHRHEVLRRGFRVQGLGFRV